jgi:uncharacterized protein (DUF983 family)
MSPTPLHPSDGAVERTAASELDLLPPSREKVTAGVLARMIGRALLLRCPHCGSRGIMKHWLKAAEQCPRCGVRPDRGEKDHWLGAYAVNLVGSEIIWALSMIAVLLATWPDVPWTFLEYGGALTMLAAPFFFYPFSRTLWLAVDLAFRGDRDADTSGIIDITRTVR